jgi:hypothetical protein
MKKFATYEVVEEKGDLVLDKKKKEVRRIHKL